MLLYDEMMTKMICNTPTHWDNLFMPCTGAHGAILRRIILPPKSIHFCFTPKTCISLGIISFKVWLDPTKDRTKYLPYSRRS